MALILLLAAAAVAAAAPSPRQCPSPTSKGCGKPSWPVTWAMRQSLYTYCFEKCPLAFFANHTDLGVFGGVVGVDHYWVRWLLVVSFILSLPLSLIVVPLSRQPSATGRLARACRASMADPRSLSTRTRLPLPSRRSSLARACCSTASLAQCPTRASCTTLCWRTPSTLSGGTTPPMTMAASRSCPTQSTARGAPPMPATGPSLQRRTTFRRRWCRTGS